jgi:hypothetical protein
MPTRRGEKDDFFGFRMKNRADYGDVREMSATKRAVINRGAGEPKGTCDPPA